MKRKYIPKKEHTRDYKTERDPDPNMRVFPCEFEREDENEWHKD